MKLCLQYNSTYEQITLPWMRGFCCNLTMPHGIQDSMIVDSNSTWCCMFWIIRNISDLNITVPEIILLWTWDWLRDWIMPLTVMQQLPRVALLILSNSFCKNWLRRLLTAFILNPKSWNQLDSLDGLALIRFNGFTYHQCRPAIILHLVCLIRIEMAQWFERNMTWEMDGLAICSCIQYLTWLLKCLMVYVDYFGTEICFIL